MRQSEEIKTAVQVMAKRFERYDANKPKIAIILGSGLGELADEALESVELAYDEIPGFPVSTVTGHAGKFIVGLLEQQPILFMQGRFHYYEGYPMRDVVLPIYAMKQFGIETLIVTNAAGGMNQNFNPGDLMLIRDHLNMTGANPLVGPNDERMGPRFPDMSSAYDEYYIELARQAATQVKTNTGKSLQLQEGVYTGITGPSYMTPAELIMLAKLGGDAVGMSTVPEVIAAKHCGLKVLGISCITDMAIGEELAPLTHEQVVNTANETKPVFKQLIREIVSKI